MNLFIYMKLCISRLISSEYVFISWTKSAMKEKTFIRISHFYRERGKIVFISIDCKKNFRLVEVLLHEIENCSTVARSHHQRIVSSADIFFPSILVHQMSMFGKVGFGFLISLSSSSSSICRRRDDEKRVSFDVQRDASDTEATQLK